MDTGFAGNENFRSLQGDKSNKINKTSKKTKMSNQYNPKIHHRESMRLKDYDYAQDGYYFVTICAENKIEYFGKIIDGKIVLNEIGKIVNQCWLEIPKHFPDVLLDEHIIMPNHIHGVIAIENNNCVVGNENFRSLRGWHGAKSRSLSSIIRGFKIGVTKWCCQNNYDFVWQKSFYDHVIRNEKSLDKIRKYIVENPLKWELDRNNPENLYM